MAKIKNIAGKKFGRLTAIKFIKRENGNTFWLCRCKCGVVKKVRLCNLVSKRTKSCGKCLLKEKYKKIGKSNTKHGEGKDLTSEYRTWGSIRSRCNNSKTPGWKNYGGRGIKVCKEWDSYEQFLKDMGRKPKGYTIERIDNNKGYSKENCKWIPYKEQYSNIRKNVVFNGEIADHASKRLGGCRGLIWSRMNLSNWSIEKAFTTPVLASE